MSSTADSFLPASAAIPAGDAALDGSPRRATTPQCRHCGAPNPPHAEFCCAGCEYVHRLVRERGLDDYYKFKDTITAPVDPAVFESRDYQWLMDLQQAAERASDGGSAEMTLGLQGISCAACVWLIERLAQQEAGLRWIGVNAQTGQMRVRWAKGDFDAAGFGRRLQAFNYLVGPVGRAGEGDHAESRALARRIGLGTAFAMNIMLFTLPTYFGMEPDFAYARLFGLLAMVFATLSFLTGGLYFIERAWRALRLGAMHIDLPIAVGIVGSFAGSLYGWFVGDERLIYFDFVGSFIVLMLIGRWAQVAAVDRNRRRLLARQPTPPRVRLVGPGEGGRSIPPEELVTGQRFELTPGQTLPVEARLEAGAAEFSLASINGEPAPRVFQPGQRVPAGAVLLSRGAVGVEALQPWRESLLARLLRPMEREADRDPVLERIIRGYLVGIFAIATGSGVVWAVLTGDAARTWSVVTAVLVVSCPCAIGLSVPLAAEMAIVALRRRGVFVRESGVFARLGRVRRVIFDKTGTLTLEAPILRAPEALEALPAAVQGALLALVRDNLHPVAQALAGPLLARGVAVADLGPVTETVGCGVEAGEWSLGRAGWRSPAGEEKDEASAVLARSGRVVARFHFADALRPDARAVMDALAGRGLTCSILSGDQGAAVARLAARLGIPAERALGELSPQDKAERADAEAGGAALMLGDGANDSLAFDRALCRGTPVIHRGVLADKADFYYLGRGLSGVAALFRVNDARRRTQVALLVFSVAYNFLAVGLAVAGRMNPLVAAVLMPLSSLASLAIVGIGMRGVWTGPERGAA